MKYLSPLNLPFLGSDSLTGPSFFTSIYELAIPPSWVESTYLMRLHISGEGDTGNSSLFSLYLLVFLPCIIHKKYLKNILKYHGNMLL